MHASDVLYYKNDILPRVFKEFAELRYCFDPQHEDVVMFDLIYNLIAYSICSRGEYAAMSWKNAYGCGVFEVEPFDDYLYRDYANRLEQSFTIFDSSGFGEFEMIRLAICYVKTKRMNLEKIFPNYNSIKT